ncbi:IrrE-like protein [Gordonia phage Morgana]|uniref:IrrE-like protein n=1 Tax=Gordonia phage Morgana TaxID=3137292 RepID=A0AAX4RCS3_9CAUD
MYDPWADIAARYPHITVDRTRSLGDGLFGEWVGDTIYLDRDLSPEQARCTLTHEIVHLDRGVPCDVDDPAEEAIVEGIAARKLIDMSDYVDIVVRMTLNNFQQIADELDVDTTMLAMRVTDFSPAEYSRKGLLKMAKLRHHLATDIGYKIPAVSSTMTTGAEPLMHDDEVAAGLANAAEAPTPSEIAFADEALAAARAVLAHAGDPRSIIETIAAHTARASAAGGLAPTADGTTPTPLLRLLDGGVTA